MAVLILAVLSLATAPLSAQSDDAGHYYRKWLQEDVLYIITAEEREVFLKLQTAGEKDAFIEQFWLRRDPNPASRENEFKEEHYRRIRFANERFHAGIPGWRTDRGRIYIAYGPPDRMETHPAGGQYLRPAHEGGGQTSTYPFERWEYRFIEGIGEDLELEFVDVSGGNLFKLTSNPFEKDELLYVPGMGLTDRELRPGDMDAEDVRRSRVLGLRDAGSARRMGIYGERAKYHPFARTELAASLSKPPVIRFKDLQEAVTARVTYNALPFQIDYHSVRLGDSLVLVPLALVVDNRVLTFQEEGGLAVNRLQVYGRVSSPARKLVYEFDDEIIVSYPAGRGRDGQTHYRRPLALEPGVYKLETLIRDLSSGHMGSLERSLQVPNLSSGDSLKISPVVLARELDRLQPQALAGQDYMMGQFKIRHAAAAVYGQDDFLALYFEIYDFAADPSTGAQALSVEYGIQAAGTSEPPAFRDITRGIVEAPDRVLVPRQISLATFTPGRYEIHFRVTDRISGQVVAQQAGFQIR